MTDYEKDFELLAPETVVRAPLGYWRVKDTPSSEELRSYYAEQYYQKGLGSYEIQYSEAELDHICAKIALRWSTVEAYFDTPGRLLDVGCGEGFVLAHAAKQGWRVHGLDFSSAGVDAQNPQCSPYLATGDVFDLLAAEHDAGHQYEIIWLQNVLEHVIDPEALLSLLHHLVTPDGALVVTVPNDFSTLQHEALAKGYIDRAFWVALPDHLSYFTATSLNNLGVETGWSCSRLMGDFPIDWFLFNSESNYIADPGKGKAAHRARIALETLILKSTPEKACAFFAGLAEVGMGRDLTAFFRPKPVM